MHKHFDYMFYLGKLAFGSCLGWIWAFNPDPIVKVLAAIASIATTVSAISTIRKNRRQ